MPSSERDYWKKKTPKKSYDEISYSFWSTEKPHIVQVKRTRRNEIGEVMSSTERDYWREKPKTKTKTKKKSGLKKFFKKLFKKKTNNPYDDIPEQPKDTIYTNPYQDE